jgi:hypothetical protein
MLVRQSLLKESLCSRGVKVCTRAGLRLRPQDEPATFELLQVTDGRTTVLVPYMGSKPIVWAVNPC